MEGETASQTGDRPRDATIVKIKDNLSNLLQSYGCLGTSQLIVEKFHTVGFAFYGQTELKERGGEDRVPKVCTLHEYLSKTSKAAKTISGNQKRKWKRREKKMPGTGPPANYLKTDVELGGDPMKTIDDLEYSDTTEIYNLGDVEHKRAFEAITVDAFSKKIFNPKEAVEHLKSLDIHMLLNVAQNSLLAFTLTHDEKKAIQALRVSRNAVVHSGKLPTINKLKNIQQLMIDALPRLNDKSLWDPIKRDCSAALSVLDCSLLAYELRAELIANAPDMYIYSRKFTIHNEGYRDTPHNISWLCDKVAGSSSSGSPLHLRVASSPGSGRTCTLLAVYQHWATVNSALNLAFKVVLPLIDKHQLDTNEVSAKSRVKGEARNNQKIGLEYRIEKSLQQWAPKCVAKHGFEQLHNAMKGFSSSDTLALVDQCNGYFAYSSTWEGPCIETGFLEQSLTIDQDYIPDEQSSLGRGGISEEVPTGQMIAQLLPLDELIVEDEFSPEANGHSQEYQTLYNQFQDRRLLTCPQMLCTFKSVTRSVVDHLELDVMRAIIKEGDEWVSRKAATYNDLMVPVGNGAVVQTVTLDLQKKLRQLAYDHILSGNQNYDVKCLPFLPSYLTGPIEGPLVFKSFLMAEYLAALHVLEHADVAAWKWLKNTPRFKRVFKFVVQMWQEQKSFNEHEKFFSNYLSVLFGLHKFEHLTASKNRKEDWNKPRPNDWTLEKEGFLRPNEDTFFKQWGLLTHVYEAGGGDPLVLSSLLKVLRQFDSWGIEWDKMSGFTTKSLQNIFRKLVASIQREGDGREQQTKVLIKLSGSVGKPDDLPAVIEALQQLKQLPCQLKVTFYYNQKDPKYGSHDHLSLLLKQSLQRLVHSEIPMLSYSGPFLLPAHSNLSQCTSFSELQEAQITVYDRATLFTFLGSCPSRLRYLSLNVDLTRQPSGPQPTPLLAAAATPSPHCRVRLALRYDGSLEILSAFSIFPRIHVLRLHGFYPPDSRTAGRSVAKDLSSVKSLNVDSLFVKFVVECKRRNVFPTDAELVSQELASIWHYDLLLSLAQCLSSVSRFIVSRLPGGGSCAIPPLVKLLCARFPKLQRLIFHDTVVSQYEASEALSFLEQSGQCPVSSGLPADFAVCKPRMNQETREQLAANKPPGFELLFLNVCDLLPINWSPTAPPNLGVTANLSHSHPIPSADEQMGYYITSLWQIVKQVSKCSLPLFCFEGHRACMRFDEHEWVQDAYHGPTIQILRSPTKDLRLHLHLNGLTDQVVFAATCSEDPSEDSMSRLLRALFPLFAAAQYLKLRVGALSASGFLVLAEAIRSHKEQQLRMQSAGDDASPPPQVDPFSLTVISVFDDALLSTKKRVKTTGVRPPNVGETGNRRSSSGSGASDSGGRLATARANYFQMACETLEACLPTLSYLSYTLFEMVHASDTKKVLYSVKKTHGGRVLKYIAK